MVQIERLSNIWGDHTHNRIIFQTSSFFINFGFFRFFNSYFFHQKKFVTQWFVFLETGQKQKFVESRLTATPSRNFFSRKKFVSLENRIPKIPTETRTMMFDVLRCYDSRVRIVYKLAIKQRETICEVSFINLNAFSARAKQWNCLLFSLHIGALSMAIESWRHPLV